MKFNWQLGMPPECSFLIQLDDVFDSDDVFHLFSFTDPVVQLAQHEVFITFPMLAQVRSVAAAAQSVFRTAAFFLVFLETIPTLGWTLSGGNPCPCNVALHQTHASALWHPQAKSG